MKDDEVKRVVKERYGRVAGEVDSCCCSSGCCGTAKPHEIGRKIGYSDEELATAPAGSNLGLGCGNPIALAAIREGETVLDLGSGAGFDCFLASEKVGPEGKVIGVDMTEEMVNRARANAAAGGYKNVEFRLGEIEKLPIEDESVDLVISNCVINLVPDKRAAFREAHRVLRPGGRLAVSDIVLLVELPRSIRESVEAYVGCIAGAISIEEYRHGLVAAGFAHVEVVDSGADLNTYAKLESNSGCCTPTSTSGLPVVQASCCSPQPGESDLHDRLADLLRRHDVNEYAASVRVYGLKPARGSDRT